jgi:molecular chaperone DnaJ
MTLAALGGEIEVPTIDGETVSIKIPEGTQYAQNITVRSKGMSQLNRTQRGDMYIQAEVYTPVHLTSKQKTLLNDFQEEEKNKTPEAQGFFNKIKNFVKNLVCAVFS